jgi:hypothetical protein
MKKGEIAWAVAIAASLCASSVQGFDYSRYQAADLDEILEQPRPKSGVDLAGARLKIIGTLIAYGEPCYTCSLKIAMLMGGIPQSTIDAAAITQCIKLRSARGKEVGVVRAPVSLVGSPLEANSRPKPSSRMS